MKAKKPIILVLGATGQIGQLIIEQLRQDKTTHLRVTTRKKKQLEELRYRYGDAVYLDLDDPRTFSDSLKDVDRLYLLTGYSVSMLVQSKAIVDAALKAGVKHIVHLGVFSPKSDCYDPHFAWHQMVEAYIKTSGIPYTFLHPNCFMQNFTGMYGMAKDGAVTSYTNDKKIGWIALEDVAEASANILIEGPTKHQGKDYWFSTESLNNFEVAKIFSEVTGAEFKTVVRSPEDFLKDFSRGQPSIDPYFEGVAESFRQIIDGRMSYIADVRDDLPKIIGRKGITLKQWAELHKKELIKLSKIKEELWVHH